MMKLKLTKPQAIQLPFMTLLLAVLIAVNVVLAIFAEAITIYLGGYGIDFSDLDYAQGNQICQDITAEGIVLLRNESSALPLKASSSGSKIPVSVFGWGATDGGFITSGAGSGSSADRGAGKLVTFFEALEGKEAQTEIRKDDDGNDKEVEIMPKVEGRFEYYKPLAEMYKTYKSGRSDDNYWNSAYPFFNLIEPSYEKFVMPCMQGAAEFSDTAIVVISRVGGEGQDMPRRQIKVDPETNNPSDNNNKITDNSRTYLQISTEEEDLIKAVRDNFDKVIVIINACNAMDLSFLEQYDVDAALSVGGTGQSGTVSIAKILNGEINPSGKTTDTYAYNHTTAATYVNGPDGREVNGVDSGERSYTNSSDEKYIDYAEGIYIGYKWYETAEAMGFWTGDFAKNKWNVNGYDEVVQYPFGFGLSYTKFEWEIENWYVDGEKADEQTEINEKTEISVKVRVSNKGNAAGQDIVQLYCTPPYYDGKIEKSAINLVAFAKTEVLDAKGGENDSQVLTLTFNAEEMKSFDYNDANGNGFSGYELEHGDYILSLRTDCHNLSKTQNPTISFCVSDDIKLAKDTSTGYEVTNRFTELSADDKDVAIDGSDTGANITFLTRADFAQTFPQPSVRRAKSSAIPANGWLSSYKVSPTKPVTETDSGLRLYFDDGSVNKQLIIELGSDFENSKWEILLNQLTETELKRIVLEGGYKTTYIKSINKPDCTDLDGPSGLNQENMTSGNVSSDWTSYPVETVLAQSWNAKLSYIYGLAVGNEAYSTGVAGWYAPACNIHRSPFDGRNFEYYSEDPILSGIMCAETTRGATNTGLYCYVKHFAVNETENNRGGLYTWLNEQALREIYLKPFEIAVKQGKANAIMSSFNRLGGTWAGGNYKLLTEVLRNEWGFKGSVVTDYVDMNAGGYMNTDQMIRAGGDLILDGTRATAFGGHSDLDKGSTTALTCAREAAHNILYTYCNTVYRQNDFAQNGDPADAEKFATEVGSKAANQAAANWKYWGWLPLDLIGFAGLSIWIYFCFVHKKLFGKQK